MSEPVFICWSGNIGHQLADAVKALLDATLAPPKKVAFVSSQLEKGAEWFTSLVGCLEGAKAGVVCLTPGNLSSPWIHFEAGMLGLHLAKNPVSEDTESNSVEAKNRAARFRLFPLLHKVKPADLALPLGAFQATTTTREDMQQMIQAIASILGEDSSAELNIGPSVSIGDKDWTEFERSIGNVSVPVREIITDLEATFQRKTFHEPVYRCADRAWIRRYDGARQVRDKLGAYLPQIRAASSAHERGLFDMLLTELDGYAMAIQALLLPPKEFKLGDDGELEVDPGIRKCCEDRRLAVRSLVGLLQSDSGAGEPLVPEAVRFMGAESNEERKMIVHVLEGRIRPEREFAFEQARALCVQGSTAESEIFRADCTALEQLTKNRKPTEFRKSLWDLDRIFYYLLVGYFNEAALRWSPGSAGETEPGWHQQDWLCAARDVEMEVERFLAKAKGGSLMPLTYALCALQEVNRHRAKAPDSAAVEERVQSTLRLIKSELGEDVLKTPDARSIRRMLDEMLETDSSTRSEAAGAD